MPISPSHEDSPEAEPAEPHDTARDRRDQVVSWLVLVDDAPPLDAEWEEWAFSQLDSVASRTSAARHGSDRDAEVGGS
jgi:hypothetical protein